ncbi:hemerythrin domain-containing protein [Desertivibrio insolitus]|uniref:hemerythrin domain-containing protein n=1 Tax=Herbiconiux sp. SYSU D00978 TaxID=2812562 RepID=UPI001A957CDE|nr:hemerythrin domain-containing protein [Herbiconiux sp. SYSU D00978]
MHPSIAEQSVEQLGGRLSVLTRQKKDHIELDELLQRLEGSEGADQERVLLDIYALVFPHAFAEESVLWPVMRRTLDDGEELTLAVEREHQEVNELVTRLETLEHGTLERSEVLDRLTEVLREDVRDEEDELFPRLQSVVDRWELRRLGLYWEIVRRIAPTRAHPVVARRPPGNVIAALPLSIVDRTRDLVDAARYAARVDPPALRAVSKGLTGAGHALEHLPFMKSGEDESTRVESGSVGSRTALVAAVAGAGLLLVLFSRRRR